MLRDRLLRPMSRLGYSAKTMAKRVLYVAMTDISANSGAAGRVRAIARDLERRGAHPVLLGMGRGRSNESEIQVAASGIRGRVRIAREAFELAKLGMFDCVILSSFGSPLNPVLANAIARLGVPLAYDCHDPPIETLPLLFDRGVFSKSLGALVKALDPMLRRTVRCVLSVSPGVDRLLQEHGWHMPIYRYYNSHSAKKFKNNTDRSYQVLRSRAGWSSSTIIIYVGALQPGLRGIEDQLVGVAKARFAGCDAKFASFGGGDARSFVRLAHDLGIAEHVFFSPPIDQGRLPAVLAESNAAVLATLPFALPSKLFEYVAAGLTILCSEETRDVCALGGDLVLPYSNGSAGLASAICHIQKKEPDANRIATFLDKCERENDLAIDHLVEI